MEINKNKNICSKSRPGKKLKLLPESALKLNETPKRVPNPAPPVPPFMDPQRHRKLLSNRMAAYNYRQRKTQYVERLKRTTEFQYMKLNLLAAQIAYGRRQLAALMMENIALERKLAVVEIEKAAREAEYQALKEERDRHVAALELMKATVVAQCMFLY